MPTQPDTNSLNTNGSPDPTNDPTSVYYIHPSDNSGNVKLVSYEFDGCGYADWKRSMMIALSARNKLCFVDGTLTPPAITDPLYKNWTRVNDLILSWFQFDLSKDIARSVLYFSTAREIWLDLEERYGHTSGTQLFSLEQDLYDLHQGSQSVSEYFTKMKMLWDEMSTVSPLPLCSCNNCTCGVNQKLVQLQQDHRLIQFLMKLNDKFAAVRVNLLMMQPLPKISHTYRLLVQEEKHKELSNTSSDSMVFAADAKRQYNNSRPSSSTHHTNYTQKNRFHNNKKKFTGSKRSNSNLFCDYCKFSGHTIDRCFQLHGYPLGFKGGKGKKVAAMACEDDNDQDGESNLCTVGQFSRFLRLMQKQEASGRGSTSQISSSDGAGSSSGSQALIADSHGLFAGPFDETATGSW